MDAFEPKFFLIAGALVVGFAFGAVSRISGFCMRSAVIEVAERRPARQTAAWVTALIVAIAGTQALATFEIVDLSTSIYLSNEMFWISLAVGGFLFGLGMILTRGCGGRHLVLAAGGNLRSWIVVTVLGLTAYATLRGILAIPRTWVESAGTVEFSESQSLPVLLAAGVGLDAGMVALALTVLCVLTGLFVLLRLARRAGSFIGMIAGGTIGLLFPAAWLVTGFLGFDEFDPTRAESVTFTAPMGEAIQYLLTYTGASADFGISVIGGTLAGAFAVALLTGTLKAEGYETPGQLARYVLGGAMMGFGGVLALGCTIGAGLSGVSTLSLGSVIALLSIVAGGAVGHRLRTGSIATGAAETVAA